MNLVGFCLIPSMDFPDEICIYIKRESEKPNGMHTDYEHVASIKYGYKDDVDAVYKKAGLICKELTEEVRNAVSTR
jgi:hypothetical protein